MPSSGSSLLTKDAFCKKSGLRSAQNRLRIDLAAGDTTIGSRPFGSEQRKRHPISGVPLPLQPPYKQEEHRNQLQGHMAPDADTITLTARLAGFEIEDHFHGLLRLLHVGPLL